MLVIWTSQVHACVENIPPSPTQWWVDCRQCRPSRRSWLGCIQQQQVYFIIFDASIMKFWKEKKEKNTSLYWFLSCTFTYLHFTFPSVCRHQEQRPAPARAAKKEALTRKKSTPSSGLMQNEPIQRRRMTQEVGATQRNATQSLSPAFLPPCSLPTRVLLPLYMVAVFGGFFGFFFGGEACLLHV